MRLLLDSDVFCKLGIGGLLVDALSVFGAGIEECGRLPALPYMLQRGRLPRIYGTDACTELLPMATSMKPVPAPETSWIDRLAPVTDIDPGEAQLFAAGAQMGLIVVTGDKRALRGLKAVEGYAEALSGRIVSFEAILIALCDRLGPAEVRSRVESLASRDKMLAACFSTGNPDPRDCLAAYARELQTELQPLRLWMPPEEEKP